MDPKENKNIPNPPVGMPRIVPHLFYDDVDAAITWLEKAFDFKTRVRMVDKKGVVVHGELEVADSLIMLGLAEENPHWECPRTFDGNVSQRLFIYVEDVNAHFEKAKAAGAIIYRAPEDRWHGERVYECVDPEGHRWKFAEPIFEVDQHNLQRPDEE